MGFLLIVLLASCTRQKTENIINDINENSNFEYGLLTVKTDEVESNFNVIEGFGKDIYVDPNAEISQSTMNEYMANNPTTYYEVTAYPDYTDSARYITSIETSDPDKHIYELSVGDEYTKEEVTAYLDTYGFEPHEEIISAYINEKVIIRVYIEDGEIYKLLVEVEITNRKDIVF